jgi:hypothetical protein
MSFSVIGGGLATGAGGAIAGGLLGGLFGDEGGGDVNTGYGVGGADIYNQIGNYAGAAQQSAEQSQRWGNAAFEPWQQMLEGGINPYTTSMIQSAQQDLLQDYANNILPRIRNTAQNAGGFGGSRQGVAEGIAAEGLLEKMGDVSARLLSDAYDVSERNRLGALGLGAQFAQADAIPASTNTDLAGIYGNMSVGQPNGGSSTLGNVLTGIGVGQEVISPIFDQIFGGNQSGGNQSGGDSFGTDAVNSWVSQYTNPFSQYL